MIRTLQYADAPALIRRKTVRLEEAERIVAPILTDVRVRGDAALLEYARKFDNFQGATVRTPVEGSLTADFERAVAVAAKNIREYATYSVILKDYDLPAHISRRQKLNQYFLVLRQ